MLYRKIESLIEEHLKSGSAVIGRAGSWFIVRLSDSPYMELSW